ncbi:CadC family transcriptional regulator [Klebsiella huaxiensis]|uniref:Winged helix-turn-helix domain-containing protein n=2 Tax=Klebsiella huaxiensis TaxID=2153354 RepID=A0A564ITS8_9ENTR|nr:MULTISPECIES: winged helix-turn-helix domain-containing protein [Klebsiella]MDG1644387.1 winged helix-turn-helix domain-containing protein [Klebsiella huaxiensis]QBG07397.1 CadC family transcriptional regulator [Klebsiella huaxiensis]VUS48304.1 hypothetical protein SB6422_00874 [Klebsiella huaxiensis]VUS56364.1 hypothetical protein SB6425_00078 [Klebsiella huaxiensis]VUS63255.1 hypothetical protein SB6421_00446 [Klebsiella huaxiensis]
MEKIYTINGKINFIPQRSVLSLIADDTKNVSLNIPVSRCLMLLIQQHGATVARETFFQEVWIKHGSQVTSNGFYQNISLLRRAFKELGVDEEIIVTVPRVGVRLEATLSVIESQPAESDAAPITESIVEPVAEEVAAAKFAEKKQLRLRRPALWGIAALLSCLVVGIVTWQAEFKSYLQNYLPINVKYSQQCHFFANNDVVEHKRHEQFINRKEFECEKYPWVYLTLYPGQARVSVISCRQQFSQWRDNQCLTNYYIKEMLNAPG